MERPPYTYTMPESFLKDDGVPARWKVLAIVQGFWFSGREMYGSNDWLEKQLGYSKRQVQYALSELEKMNLISRPYIKGYRYIMPGGAIRLHGGVQLEDEKHAVGLHPISDSISDSKYFSSEDAPRVVSVSPSKEKKVRADAHILRVFKVIGGSTYPKFWEARVPQRDAADRLYKDRGLEQIQRAVEFLRENKGEKYMPSIHTPVQLEEKWENLLDKKEQYG